MTGKKADAILAAHLASEAALRLVKPGNETYEVICHLLSIYLESKCKYLTCTLGDGDGIKNW